jgi:hypothetical protein
VTSPCGTEPNGAVGMVLRNRYFLLYLACAVVLGIPSYLVWSRTPFLITKNEFDYFIGLFAPDFRDIDPRLAMLGKGIHFVLIVLMGWAYYRLITELGEKNVPLRWRDVVVPSALLIGVSFCYLPWHSPDVFFYFGTGWLESHHGLNPYQHVIADAPGSETDPAFQNVFPAWRYIITPYGPLFVKFIGAVIHAAGGDDRLGLVLVKAAFALSHVLNGWLVAGIARRLGFKERLAVLMYLLGPVPLLDYIGWAHNDVLMISCLLAAMWAALADRPVLATLFLGVGAGLMYVPILFAPYVFLYLVRRRSPAGQVPRLLGLGLLLGAAVLVPCLWYDNGLWNFLRLFRGQDQKLQNIVHITILSVVARSADEATVLATLQVVKLVLKLIFLGVGGAIAYRLWRRGPAMTPNDLFSSIVILLLVYFTVSSPEINEWYAGWILCFIFWVNNRAYYNIGMVVMTVFNALAIFQVRTPPSLSSLAMSAGFLTLWAGLYYLWKQYKANAWQPSPLAGSSDSLLDARLPELAYPVAQGLGTPVAS